MRVVSFTLNGKPTSLTVDETRPLLWVLRDDLGLTGSKFGCGEGICGSCTVVVENKAVRSCVTAVGDVQGKRVLTIEGVATDGRLHPIQQAFADHAAYQCGYCTPGMIVNAYALLEKTQKPTREQILKHMEGNLCRCGSHQRIVEAIEDAALMMKGGGR